MQILTQHVTQSWQDLKIYPTTIMYTIHAVSLCVLPGTNVLLITGQQTPDYEERRNPDTQPQDVQQVQEEQAGRGRFRGAV